MLLFFNSSISPSFVFLMLYYVLENRCLVLPPACSLIATPMAVVTLFGSTDIVITLSMPNR